MYFPDPSFPKILPMLKASVDTTAAFLVATTNPELRVFVLTLVTLAAKRVLETVIALVVVSESS